MKQEIYMQPYQNSRLFLFLVTPINKKCPNPHKRKTKRGLLPAPKHYDVAERRLREDTKMFSVR